MPAGARPPAPFNSRGLQARGPPSRTKPVRRFLTGPIQEPPLKSPAYLRYRKDHCERCGWFPPTKAALDVDHVLPREQGGDLSDPSNLQTLCPNCHRLKTLAERGLIPMDDNSNVEHLPLETPLKTPLKTPIDIGQDSGGEYQQGDRDRKD